MKEIYKSIFDSSMEPQFILEKSSHNFVDVNKLFEALTGYRRDELVGKLQFTNLVEDNHIKTLLETADDLKTEVKLKTKNGQLLSVQLQLFSMGENNFAGFARDLTEKKLYVESAWEKIEEIIKSNSRLGIIKEKLEAMQELARELLDLKSVNHVFECATDFMQKRDKLGYAKATFYLLEGKILVPALSETKTRDIKIDKKDGLADLLTGKSQYIEKGNQLFVALNGKEGIIGVMDVQLPQRELESLKGNEVAIRGYRDIVIAIAEIIGLVLENIRLYERIFEQSIVDPLTGLYNRRYLDSKLEEELSRTTRYKRPLSLLMADVNGFKQVNDTYGHKQGDLTLQEIAKIIKASSRQTDIVARYGGDEFMILMPETTLENANVKGHNLTQEIASSKFTNLYSKNEPIRLSIAVGICQYPPGASTDDFLRTVDKTMYQDKQKFYDIIKGAE